LNKKSELLTVIASECKDIICVTETLPKNYGGKIVPVDFQLPGFDCFHNLNEEQCSRGVALWVRTSYGAQQFKLYAEHQSARESVWCEITLKGKDGLLIGVIYRSPNSASDNNKVPNSLLPSMSFSRSHTLIIGDFNHPEIDWADESSPRDGNHTASLFLESVRDSFLIHNITKPIHFRGKQTPNILDLVFTSEEYMKDELRHEAPLGKSHHQSLFFSIKCYAEKTLRKRERLNFAKGDYDKLREAVNAVNISDSIRDMNVADSWSFLKDTVMSAVDACVPKITLGGVKKSQWTNSTVKAQLKTNKEAYKRY
jgi:exonuclease III